MGSLGFDKTFPPHKQFCKGDKQLNYCITSPRFSLMDSYPVHVCIELYMDLLDLNHRVKCNFNWVCA